ncbi:MAG: phosphatidylserine/phosphatidylglycerophosphate/cardiolipin synthase family protein [Bacteroidota bacterium]
MPYRDNTELTYHLYDDPMEFYAAQLKDIDSAKKYIYIETYRFGNDAIGKKFRLALNRKAREGVEIRLLIDSYGSQVNLAFFEELEQLGGQIRFFRKIVYTIDFFTKNHRRNHRKLIIIDDHISYIGSANITGYSLNWREMVIRLTGGIALPFKKTYLDSWDMFNKYTYNKFSFKKTIHYRDYEIVQDIPSIYRQQIKKKFERLVKMAQKEVIIETPYFLPGFMLRKELMEASRRGVDVKIIIPQHSDVTSVDLIRGRYLGMFHKSGIKIFFYTSDNLHAKCITVDQEIFGIMSANVDYRSFRYQHEIGLFGSEPGIIHDLNVHLVNTIDTCIDFDYVKWMKRPRFERFLSWLLVPFRHLY